MSLNKLKNVALGIAVLAVAVGGSIESADAGFAKGSSRAVNTDDFFLLEIDTSVADNLADLTKGLFPGVVKAVYQDFDSSTGTTLIRNINFTGDLKSFLVEDPTEIANITTQPIYSSFGDEFVRQGKAVRYEGRLNNTAGNSIDFDFYAPFSNPNTLSLISSSNLASFLNSQGEVKFPRRLGILDNPGSSGGDTNGFTFTFVETPVEKVPESSTLFSILFLGSLACISHLKQINHKKIFK
jgi:hypothetical protein